jgi:hypothetical protein
MSGSRYWNQAVILPPPHHKENIYFLSFWNQGHLDVVLMMVVRVVRTGLGLSTDMFGQEEKAALCSEAPYEDALIQGQA